MVYPGFYAPMHIHHHWGISHAGRGFSFIPVKKFGLYNSDLLPLRGDLLAPSGATDFPGRSRWLRSLTTQTTNKNTLTVRKAPECFYETNNEIWGQMPFKVWNSGVWSDLIEKTKQNTSQCPHKFMSNHSSFPSLALFSLRKMIQLLI